MKGLGLCAALIVGAMSLSAVPAVAATGLDEDLFGTSSYVTPGNASPQAVKIEADVGTEYGGIDFPGTVPVDIENFNLLSTDYFFPTGSSCGGGAPRFILALETGQWVEIPLGAPPSYTGCPDNVWLNTGNLVAPTATVIAQNAGGPYYEAWALTQARLAGTAINDIYIVTDTFAGPRTAVVDNTNVNNTLYQYEDVSYYVDHYVCYDADPVTKFQQRSVTLRDEFGPPSNQDPNRMKVRTPTSFCTPVDKNGEGITFKDFQLVCYEVDEHNSVRTVITVDNQFGDDQKLLVTNREQLCVPSTDEIIGKLPKGHHHNNSWHKGRGHHGRW